jgi:hypothetical protein
MSDERSFSTANFKSFLERYHLKDQVGNVEIKIQDNQGERELYTEFKSKDGGTVKGDVSLAPFEFEREANFGIWNTQQLISLLQIMDDRFDLDLIDNPQGGVAALKFEDDFRTVKFHTSKLKMIRDAYEDFSLKLKKNPPVAAEVDLDDEFTNSFTKGINAVEEDPFSVRAEDGGLVFELGWRRHAGGNTVKLRPESNTDTVPDFDEMVFKGDLMRNILKANSDDPGYMRISPAGMLMMHFRGDMFESNYYMTKKS